MSSAAMPSGKADTMQLLKPFSVFVEVNTTSYNISITHVRADEDQKMLSIIAL